MGTTLNSRAYKQIIKEDIEEIKKYMPKSLERTHIIDVLNWSAKELYKD
jgi:hypothetical protein